MTPAKKRFLKFCRDLDNKCYDALGMKRHDRRWNRPIKFGGVVELRSGKQLKIDGYDALITYLKDIFYWHYDQQKGKANGK